MLDDTGARPTCLEVKTGEEIALANVALNIGLILVQTIRAICYVFGTGQAKIVDLYEIVRVIADGAVSHCLFILLAVLDKAKIFIIDLFPGGPQDEQSE